MKHAVPAYLEWWRAYLTLSYGCSQLMLKSMQQVLDASVAAWVYRPASAAARLSPVLPMPAMVAPAVEWSPLITTGKKLLLMLSLTALLTLSYMDAIPLMRLA